MTQIHSDEIDSTRPTGQIFIDDGMDFSALLDFNTI